MNSLRRINDALLVFGDDAKKFRLIVAYLSAHGWDIIDNCNSEFAEIMRTVPTGEYIYRILLRR